MAVISVHGEVRHHQPQSVVAAAAGSSRSLFAANRDEASSYSLVAFKGSDSIEGSFLSLTGFNFDFRHFFFDLICEMRVIFGSE